MHHRSNATRFVIKYVVTAALLLSFGVAAALAQSGPVNMTVSGSAAASTVSLQGKPANEYQLAGSGSLGQFTLRVLSNAGTPQQSANCSGPMKLYVAVSAGAAIARFQDGDLLTLNLTGGSDCIDFAAGAALCIRMFQVTAGTGRFRNAAGGSITLTMTVVPVLADGPTNPVFFAVIGEMTGAVPRNATGLGPQDQ